MGTRPRAQQWAKGGLRRQKACRTVPERTPGRQSAQMREPESASQPAPELLQQTAPLREPGWAPQSPTGTQRWARQWKQMWAGLPAPYMERQAVVRRSRGADADAAVGGPVTQLRAPCRSRGWRREAAAVGTAVGAPDGAPVSAALLPDASAGAIGGEGVGTARARAGTAVGAAAGAGVAGQHVPEGTEAAQGRGRRQAPAAAARGQRGSGGRS